MPSDARSTPLSKAVERISAKTPLGTTLKSKRLEKLPLALWERSQMSARVESARILSSIQERLEQSIGQVRAAVTRLDGTPDTVLMTRDRFRADVGAIAKDELGGKPREGGVRDIRNLGRLELIYDMQTQDAREYARWTVDTDEENLNAVPAQELVRVESRREVRDWLGRWAAAGGQLIQGRMVALKNNPVWTRISRFGKPWPPYDYGSGMGLKDIYRSEAVKLGLIDEAARVKPTQLEDFNSNMQASARGLSPAMIERLRAMGLTVRDGKLVLK